MSLSASDLDWDLAWDIWQGREGMGPGDRNTGCFPITLEANSRLSTKPKSRLKWLPYLRWSPFHCSIRFSDPFVTVDQVHNWVVPSGFLQNAPYPTAAWQNISGCPLVLTSKAIDCARSCTSGHLTCDFISFQSLFHRGMEKYFTMAQSSS